MIINGVVNKIGIIKIEGKTNIEVKNPELKHKPTGFMMIDGKIKRIPRRDIAKSLCKNYIHTEVILEETGENITQIRRHLETLNIKGLIIIKTKKRRAVDFCFIDRNYGFNKNDFLNKTNQIKAGHKRYNASKDFKLRQSIGQERIERFKLYAMGIKENRNIF